jgi:hypothetical protein
MRAKMTMMGLVLVAVVGLGQTCAADPITYNLVDYSSLENGWTLSGTITTDGTIGALAASDITSWTFTITKVWAV